jgi:hypothetical protein
MQECDLAGSPVSMALARRRRLSKFDPTLLERASRGEIVARRRARAARIWAAPSSEAVLAVETNRFRLRWRAGAATAVISALCVDLASGHLNSSDKAPGSRRRNEKGKVEWLGGRRNSSRWTAMNGARSRDANLPFEPLMPRAVSQCQE